MYWSGSETSGFAPDTAARDSSQRQLNKTGPNRRRVVACISMYICAPAEYASYEKFSADFLIMIRPVGFPCRQPHHFFNSSMRNEGIECRITSVSI